MRVCVFIRIEHFKNRRYVTPVSSRLKQRVAFATSNMSPENSFAWNYFARAESRFARNNESRFQTHQMYKPVKTLRPKDLFFRSVHPLPRENCQTSKYVFLVLFIQIPDESTVSPGETVPHERGFGRNNRNSLCFGC